MVARSVRCWPARNANRSRSSPGMSKRIELASLVSGTISATRSAWKCSAMLGVNLPLGVRIGAWQKLHHCEQVTEVLAVMPAAPTKDWPLVSRRFELPLGEHSGDRGAIFILELARIGRDASVNRRLKARIHFEQLRNESPVPIEPLSHPERAFLRPVAEANGPFGREFAVVGHFLHRLVREFAEEAVARLLQTLEQHVLPRRIKEVARDCLRKVTVGLLDQQAIAKIQDIAVKGELVAIARLAKE